MGGGKIKMLTRTKGYFKNISTKQKTSILMWLIGTTFMLCSFTGLLSLTGLKGDYDRNYTKTQTNMTYNQILVLSQYNVKDSTQLHKIKNLWERYKHKLQEQESRHKILVAILRHKRIRGANRHSH